MNMLDDWQRVKAVFEQALAVDETERSAFLAAACGSDALLRQRVDALLASHAASQSFLETGASSVLELPRPGAGSERADGSARIGCSRASARARWARCMLAHDEKLNRRVAVKLIATHARTRCRIGCSGFDRKRMRLRASTIRTSSSFTISASWMAARSSSPSWSKA